MIKADKLIPMTCKVLLLMDKMKLKKIGKIEIPEDTAAQLKTYESGVVIALGDTAFDYASKSKQLCKVGDRVYIVKFSGVVVTENAGYTTTPQDDMPKYRIVNDEDILVVEEKDD